MHNFGAKRPRRRALGAGKGSKRDQETGLKIIAVQEAEGGLVVHKPDGSQAIVPTSDDRERNAAHLGELVLEIMDDDAQPCAEATGPGMPGGSAGGGDGDGGEKGEYHPRPGESADAYVRRVSITAGFRGASGFWKTLQRMSGTKNG